jgi:hypothetical protein
MIIKKEKKNGITILHVRADKTDAEMEKIKSKLINPSTIKDFITDDTDVYTEDNRLLLKFRKNKLNKANIEQFFDNVINFAETSYSSNRGSASGSKNKNLKDNKKVYSNIIGYMDTFSPSQKMIMKQKKISLKFTARECRFNIDHPDKYNNLIPLVQDIDHFYKVLLPEYYAKQYKKASQTFFRIPKTSFTTITTNVNFQTSIHKDKGDDKDGFGNLSVIEEGEYSGAETCMPQYGIGVDVRTSDVLFMDVHEWHGNLPMIKKEKDAIRLSIVCYLRYNIWKNTQKVSKAQMIKHNKTIKNMKKQ